MVTDFRAPNVVKQSTGVVERMQGQGHALVAGGVRVIRVWNVATECCTRTEENQQTAPSSSTGSVTFRNFLYG